MAYDQLKRLLRNIDFALKPTDGEAHGCFWKLQPLVDAFNENRKNFKSRWKLVVDVDSWPRRTTWTLAISWNEGKKDKIIEKIVKKNIIATCGTTLQGKAHKKRRWQVHEDGTISTMTIDIKTPAGDGGLLCWRAGDQRAQPLSPGHSFARGPPDNAVGLALLPDVPRHRGGRPVRGVKALPPPGKQDVTHNHFLLSIIEYLLHKKIGVPDSVPVLQPRAARAVQVEAVVGVHDLRSLEQAAYFANSGGKKRGVHTCHVCRMKCYCYCATCSSDGTVRKGLAALCGSGTGRRCFVTHQTRGLVPSAVPNGVVFQKRHEP
jgi:hypothetical protein